MQCSTQTNKPVVAAKMPFRVKVTGGKRYVWCACGHSKKQVGVWALNVKIHARAGL